MASRYNKAFSLLEVVITVAILSTALVFILRGFSTVMFAARLSQDIMLAGLVAEEKLWDVQQGIAEAGERVSVMQGREFSWDYSIAADPALAQALNRLDLAVRWQESRAKEEKLDVSTYLLIK